MSVLQPSPTGSIGAAISNAVVGLMHDYTGRGPTKAKTTISGDLVVVLLADIMTKAETTLVDDGQGGFVLDMRHRLQNAMREGLIATVEMNTERKVIAFMSENHIDPDMAAEVFVLEPQPDGDQPEQAAD